MTLDRTTRELFCRFPRETGLFRSLVYNQKDLETYLSYNNGIDDCYTSVYSSNLIIDKIFFDFDYGRQVLEDAKMFYKFCLDNEYPSVPIVSGRKGYHIYLMFRPKIYKEKTRLLLTKASLSMIKSVYGKFRQEVYCYPSGKRVQVFRNEDRLIAPDPTVCGDPRRICRLPNTMRPPGNENYCTYLPPGKFLDMSEEDVEVHMKSRHSYKYNVESKLLLTDFDYDFEEEESLEWETLTRAENTPSNPSLFLRFLLRPCLYRHITSIHPSHPVRVAVTLDLLQSYDTGTIISIYESLGWEDFSIEETTSQVLDCEKRLREKQYKPYSCSKLRAFGIPNSCCVS